MKYPIVQVKTSDGIWLHGLFLESTEAKTLFLNIHGTASNFYEEYFIEVMSQTFLDKGISMLSVNNRGAGVYDAWQNIGAAVEKFEDCIADIDAWIQFATDKNYTNVILSGHSLGAEKVVYYVNHGKYCDKVSAIVLLGPADSFGSHRLHNGKDNTGVRASVENNLRIAESLVKEGCGDAFLSRNAYGSHRGIMPKSAESFLNFLGKESKLVEGLPFVQGKLESYAKIRVPILAVIGDKEEYTGLTIDSALELMRRENKLTETVKFKGCDHDFQGKEHELTDVVLEFITRINAK